MQIPGALAKVGGDTALYLLTVYQVPLHIHIQHPPDMARDGELLPHGRRQHHGAQLLGFVAHGVFLVLLEYAVELKGIDYPLSRQAYDEAALFRLLDMVCFDQVAQEDPVIVPVNPVKIA